MFIPPPDIKVLRQGDIITNVLFPLLRISDLTLLGKQIASEPISLDGFKLSGSIDNKKYVSGMIKLQVTSAIIISQCCDVQLNNGKLEVPNFVLAPLDPVKSYPGFKDNAHLEDLKKNELDRFTNLFYLDPAPPISEQSVVNFNRTFCLQKEDYEIVLSRKVLQMTDESRVKFKLKLANHFGRPTEDELERGLYLDSGQPNASL